MVRDVAVSGLEWATGGVSHRRDSSSRSHLRRPAGRRALRRTRKPPYSPVRAQRSQGQPTRACFDTGMPSGAEGSPLAGRSLVSRARRGSLRPPLTFLRRPQHAIDGCDANPELPSCFAIFSRVTPSPARRRTSSALAGGRLGFCSGPHLWPSRCPALALQHHLAVEPGDGAEDVKHEPTGRGSGIGVHSEDPERRVFLLDPLHDGAEVGDGARHPLEPTQPVPSLIL